jgi:hypothetical protein
VPSETDNTVAVVSSSVVGGVVLLVLLCCCGIYVCIKQRKRVRSNYIINAEVGEGSVPSIDHLRSTEPVLADADWEPTADTSSPPAGGLDALVTVDDDVSLDIGQQESKEEAV